MINMNSWSSTPRTRMRVNRIETLQFIGAASKTAEFTPMITFYHNERHENDFGIYFTFSRLY